MSLLPPRRLASLTAPALALLLAGTTSGEPQKLMVMDVVANDVTPTFADAVTELVAVEMSRYGPLDVASGSDVRKLLELEASKEMASCDDETSCMVAVAGALGAELIVHGKAAKLGETTLVTLHLFDVGEGRSLARTSFQVKGADELPARVKEAVARLADGSFASRGITSSTGGAKVAGAGSPPPREAAPAPTAPVLALADLEALAEKKAWRELIGRALDVPPASRSARWEELVAKGAAEGLEKARARDAYEALALDEQLSDLFPSALARSPYKEARRPAVREGVEACFARANAAERRFVADRASIPDCARLAEAYAERADIPPDEAQDLARIVRRNRHPSAAVTLFARAVPKKGAAGCKDDDLELAVVSGLHEPPDGPLARHARTLAFERCFEQMKGPVKKELTRAGTRRYFLNACPELLKRGDLGKLQKRRCERRLSRDGE